MSLTKEQIQEQLNNKYGKDILSWEESYGMLSFTVKAESNLEIARFMYHDERLKFQFLTDITAVHYPDKVGAELCVVTHLHNLVDNVRIRMKAYMPIEKPDTYSLVPLFLGANWMERETF